MAAGRVFTESGFELPLDEDGTPLLCGERMVEVAPGVWRHPTWVAIETWLTEHVPGPADD